MSHNLLKGKKGIIFGALNDMSIAWKVAERAHEEGASFTLTNAPIAMRMGAINDLAKKTNSKIIPADATSIDDLNTIISIFSTAIKTDTDKILKVNNKTNIPKALIRKTEILTNCVFSKYNYESELMR